MTRVDSMADSTVKDCWDAIQRNVGTALFEYPWPLSNIQDCLRHFDLPPLPSAASDIKGIPDMGPAEPSFGNLTDDALIWLRQQIYADAQMERVASWAEKLMRFCEIRYSVLKKRSLVKCGCRARARLHLLHLSIFFLDYGLRVKDLRFLSTALKLADMKWLTNPATLAKRLKNNNRNIVAALFEFKMMLITGHALDDLRAGGAR